MTDAYMRCDRDTATTRRAVREIDMFRSSMFFFFAHVLTSELIRIYVEIRTVLLFSPHRRSESGVMVTRTRTGSISYGVGGVVGELRAAANSACRPFDGTLRSPYANQNRSGTASERNLRRETLGRAIRPAPPPENALRLEYPPTACFSMSRVIR